MGLTISLQNTGLIFAPLVTEEFLNIDGFNKVSVYLFIFLIIIGVSVSLLILFEDKNKTILENLGTEKDKIKEDENDIENEVNKVFKKVEFKNDNMIKHIILR